MTPEKLLIYMLLFVIVLMTAVIIFLALALRHFINQLYEKECSLEPPEIVRYEDGSESQSEL